MIKQLDWFGMGGGTWGLVRVRLNIAYSGLGCLPRLEVLYIASALLPAPGRQAEWGRATCLLAPLSVDLRQLNGELSQVCHFLPLKAVQIGLQRRRGVLEVLRRCLQRVFELQPDQPRFLIGES